jgi:hypothetical protein
MGPLVLKTMTKVTDNYTTIVTIIMTLSIITKNKKKRKINLILARPYKGSSIFKQEEINE